MKKKEKKEWDEGWKPIVTTLGVFFLVCVIADILIPGNDGLPDYILFIAFVITIVTTYFIYHKSLHKSKKEGKSHENTQGRSYLNKGTFMVADPRIAQRCEKNFCEQLEKKLSETQNKDKC